MTATFYNLRATLSDGFIVKLEGDYPSINHANRAAQSYMRHYSDPCGLGLHVSQVAVIEVSEIRTNLTIS